MSEREEWMNLIRNEYDPAPTHYRMGDDWDDGAGRIADAILADKTLLLRKQETSQPSVVDFDDGEISVRLDGKELRGWIYKDDAERRSKMLAAREYVEGWCDGHSFAPVT